MKSCGDKALTASGDQGDIKSLREIISVEKNVPPVSLAQVESKSEIARRVSDDTIAITVPSYPSTLSRHTGLEPDIQHATFVQEDEASAVKNKVEETEIPHGSEENSGNLSGLAALSAAALLRLCDRAPSEIASEKTAPSNTQPCHQLRPTTRTIIF